MKFSKNGILGFLLFSFFLLAFGSGFIPNHPAPDHETAFASETASFESEAAPCYLGGDLETPRDVYWHFKAEGFSHDQAVFFAKQAAFETGDPNNAFAELKPVSGANNVFGLRTGNAWFSYDSKFDAVADYSKSILDSKYYSATADAGFIVTARNHCPDNADYAAQVEAVKFDPFH